MSRNLYAESAKMIFCSQTGSILTLHVHSVQKGFSTSSSSPPVDPASMYARTIDGGWKTSSWEKCTPW